MCVQELHDNSRFPTDPPSRISADRASNHVCERHLTFPYFSNFCLASVVLNTFIRVSQSTFQGCFHRALCRENQETASAIASAIRVISHRHNYPVIINCALILAESIAAERLRKQNSNPTLMDGGRCFEQNTRIHGRIL
jgi:hypothetical protein